MPAGSPSDLPLSPKAQQLAKEWAQNPQSKVFVPLAEEYAKLGMLQRAAMVLEEGIGTYPGYVIAMVALGAVYFEMKEFESAKEVLEAAIESSPENMKAHRVLAQIYAADGNTEAARRSCTVVLMTNPFDDEIKHLERTLGNAEAASPAILSPPQRGRRKEDRFALPAGPKARTVSDRQVLASVPTPPASRPGATDSLALPRGKPIARLEQWLARIQAVRRTG